MYELLDAIQSPAELRQLDRKALPRLADELRQFLLESVAATGGHLSSNLAAAKPASQFRGHLGPRSSQPRSDST